MVASRNDSYILSQDAGFQQRVKSSLIAACVAIANEGWNVPFHRERAGFSSQILSSTQTNFVTLFSASISTDATVLGDATQGGTVTLSTSNVATQAALATDAHIDSAISSQFNAFIKEPAV